MFSLPQSKRIMMPMTSPQMSTQHVVSPTDEADETLSNSRMSKGQKGYDIIGPLQAIAN
jgi:hypothetical protein